MPHKLSGFTPFEVVYGLNLHTLLFDSWLDSSMEPQSLCKWMVKFEERTKIVRETMRERINEVKENERVKEEVKKLRVIKEGDEVLFRVPGLGNMLSLVWQGPFVVKRRVGDVNYEVENGEAGKKRLRTVHVNNLKLWHHEQVIVQRIVVTTDDLPG